MMKKVIFSLFFLVSSAGIYAQENKSESFAKDAGATTELPEMVIKKTGKVSSVYVPDKNPDKNVRLLQEKFIGYNLGKDYEGYDDYFVTMKTEDGNGVLEARYNVEGKLMHVEENYENVVLPNAVRSSVNTKFPGWDFVKEQFFYAQDDGKITKRQYSIKITKEKNTKKIVLRPDGEIVAGL